ncbi:SusD family protein [Mucilaginibacter pineti]|uniref:SusD family protein n=1 Tax=Mucilaginibacter pineti TaxID=1391627 RepID=A0A1G7FVA0_9SPHI|nr:RagB/SusD family nutrient uptake outer membrane protein [Mucilaginibacter pineti]SDE79675.1 SusD family protein [Mucilaginibacter pineti]
MKKINLYITTGLMSFVAITSCKKIDKLQPHDSITVGEAFKTVKDAAAWDVGTYAIFRNNQYGEFMVGTDVQGDQLNASLDYGNRNGSEHRWGQFFLSSDGLLSDIWGSYYSAIANINTAIEGFKTIKPADATETASLNKYTGDAYFARAFYYHNLILRFAKPYEPSTAATDLGVPLVIAYNLQEKPKRATVKAVYDQILSDLNTAKGLLASVKGTQGAQAFNVDVVTALEARVRLNMHDWAGAYTAANTLVNSSTYQLITDVDQFKDYWTNDGVKESIFQSYVSTTQLPNANTIYLGFNSGNSKYDPDFIPSQWVYDTFAKTDIRKATYFDLKACNIQGVDYSLVLVNKYPGNPALFTSNVSNYENAPKVFRVAEQYLIAAEAADNNSNSSGALTALNALRGARGLVQISASGAALTDSIRVERFRELAFEGFRLNDLKRWHLGFQRRDPQNVDAIQTAGNYYDKLKINADDNKFVWGIPLNDITANLNIKDQQNPGW